MQSVTCWWARVRRAGQKLGPYLMLEILMPGGTLLALLLFLYQRRKAQGPLLIAGAAERVWAQVRG
jgi:hypothetical protein